MSLNEKIVAMLKAEGCDMVGFADLRILPKEVRQNFDYGIAIALPYTKEAMTENLAGSPQRYHEEDMLIEERLTKLDILITYLLIKEGYKVLARFSPTIVQDEEFRTILPHKTVATLSGMGWIGKCAALVTEEAGSAIVLGVVLTNAPLDCGTPVTRSKCRDGCKVCMTICPGKAVLGRQWEAGIDRDVFFNAGACRRTARARAKTILDIDETTLCGLCVSSCPFTKRGLGYK